MDDSIFPGLMACIFACISVGVIASSCERDSVEKEAAKANVGKYVVDEKTGKAEFTWVTNIVYITNGVEKSNL